MKLSRFLAALIIVLTVSFAPLAMAQTTVLHLHSASPLKSPAGFIMDETAPSLKGTAQQVSASCTFFGPAATSTYTFQPGTYAYVIFATGPEISYNVAAIAIEVFRSASSSFEDIPGITPRTISGGGCPPSECIIKNEGEWAVSSEVTLSPGDRLALVITSTGGKLNVLSDGSLVDQATKQNVFTDSSISFSGSDPDRSAVGGYVASVNRLDLLAPWLALFFVVGVIVGTAIIVVNKREND
jgi:hypothetical protein